MDLHSLFTDDRAISPVIGVILMVAITVVLVGVAGTMVLEIGNQNSEEVPTATFDYTWNGTVLTIEHAGGTKFKKENSGGGSIGCDTTGLAIRADGRTVDCWKTPISSGQTFVIDSDSPGSDPDSDYDPSHGGGPYAVENGDEVRIVWQSPRSDDVHVLARFDIK